MNMKGQPYKPLTSPKRKIRWVLADVEVLPSASNWKEGSDRAVVHIIMPAFSHKDAAHKLKEELPKHGYEFRYVDEFEAFEDVDWKTPEAKALYNSLFRKAEETRQIQFGNFYFYSSTDEDAESIN